MGAAAVATTHSETGPAIGRYRTLNSPLATHSGCLSEGPPFVRAAERNHVTSSPGELSSCGASYTRKMANEQEPDGEDLEALVDAYDLDDDGKISLIEQERARLGVVDARLEEIAEGDGLIAKIADVTHKVVDRIDND